MSSQSETNQDSGVKILEKKKVKRPKKYKVLVHNDDYTTMEFVVFILQSIFKRSYQEAHHLMLEIHKKGHAVCGVYSHEIAETKRQKTIQLARDHEHPLQCTVEPE